jgi:hypothetical protein
MARPVVTFRDGIIFDRFRADPADSHVLSPRFFFRDLHSGFRYFLSLLDLPGSRTRCPGLPTTRGSATAIISALACTTLGAGLRLGDDYGRHSYWIGYARIRNLL